MLRFRPHLSITTRLDLSCNPPCLNPRPATRQQHILRLLNTNVKGGGKIMFALTEIKGVGRRYANLVCKKADVDLNKRCVRFFDVGGTERGVWSWICLLSSPVRCELLEGSSGLGGLWSSIDLPLASSPTDPSCCRVPNAR